MLATTGGGVSEAWLRAWMNSWDTPFGTPPWQGGFGGGMDRAETWSFGSGMGDMASLYYGPEYFGPEFPGVNDALITRKILGVLAEAGQRTDADGFPIGFNAPSGISNEELLLSAHASPPSLDEINEFGLARKDRLICGKGGCHTYDADEPVFTPGVLAIYSMGVGLVVGPIVLEALGIFGTADVAAYNVIPATQVASLGQAEGSTVVLGHYMTPFLNYVFQAKEALLYPAAQAIGGQVLDFLPGEISAITPYIDAASRIVFFTAPQILGLTAQELNYIVSNPDLIRKTIFAFGGYPSP